VTSFTGWPSQFPFFATLELGTANEEIVSVTNIVGATATIVRGQDGSTAISHLAGATFDFTVVSQDFDEANAHTSANSGVHGVSGNLVGTSDVQTLTNKSLTSPTVTGTLSGASETLSGTLAVTGTSTLGVVNASGAVHLTAASTALNVDNNVTIGGTEAVTGASTAASYSANGNGTVSGVVVPRQYANQAAAGTATAGNIVYLTAPTGTGAIAGPFIGDGTIWKPLTPAARARVRKAATQSIPNAAWTQIAFDTTDFSAFGTAGSTGFTVIYAGVYAVSGGNSFVAGATATRRGVAPGLNNTLDPGGQSLTHSATVAASVAPAMPMYLIQCSAGDTINLYAFQDSGGALNVTSMMTVTQYSY
jgi:hypothetical protein